MTGTLKVDVVSRSLLAALLGRSAQVTQKATMVESHVKTAVICIGPVFAHFCRETLTVSTRCVLHVPTPGGNYSARLLSENVPIQANRTYQLSVWSLLNASDGERPWVWIVQLDTAGAEIKHLPVGATLYQSTKFVESELG